MKTTGVLTITFLLAFAGLAQARESIKSSGNSSIEIIDVPTADVVDHYGYHVSFRFGKDGNLQNKTVFGVFPRLNLGFGLDGEQVIGTEKGRMNKPTINLKFRPFDGQGVLPAIALGFDGQGYRFNKAIDEYEQREKGFYLAATWHPYVPEFQWTLGGDIYDFDHGNPVRGYTGITYTYQQMVALMLEYDNFDYYKLRRINYGMKLYITPVFTVDLIGRNVAKYPGSKGRETERVIRLSYTGSF